MLKWIAGYFRRARLERELSQLDDRLLADIGISRADALAEADRAPWDVEPRQALWYAGLYTSPYGMEPWRMASYALVHDVSGPTHLLLNMLALWVIGRVLEPALGWWRFLALYVLSAVGGAVLAAL